ISYLIQSNFGPATRDSVEVGSTYSIDLTAGGANSVYTWSHNGEPISGFDGPVYVLASVDRQTMGEYKVKVTNPLLPGFILESNPHTVMEYTNIVGRLFSGSETPSSAGEVTLYRVQPGAFEPVETVPLSVGGKWHF